MSMKEHEKTPQQEEKIDVNLEDIILAIIKEKTKSDLPS